MNLPTEQESISECWQAFSVQGLCQELQASFITYIRYIPLMCTQSLQADAPVRTPRLHVHLEVFRIRRSTVLSSQHAKSSRVPVVSIAETHLHVLRIHFPQYDLTANLSCIKLLTAPHKLLVPVVVQALPFCCSSIACYQTNLTKVSDSSSVVRCSTFSQWSLS